MRSVPIKTTAYKRPNFLRSYSFFKTEVKTVVEKLSYITPHILYIENFVIVVNLVCQLLIYFTSALSTFLSNALHIFASNSFKLQGHEKAGSGVEFLPAFD